jgi:hypothetical protein
MKKFVAALVLFTIIAIPTLSSAATVSPSSPEFGSNGY